MPLHVHFLNVGHGDCTVIEHPSGRITMVDINNTKSLPDSDIAALAAEKHLTVESFRKSRILAPLGFASWEDYYRSFLIDPYDWFVARFGTAQSVFRYIQTHPDMDHMSGLCRFFWQGGIPLENMWDTAHTKAFEEEDFTHSPYDYLDWLVYKAMRNGVLKDKAEHKVLQLHQGASAPFYADDNITILGPTPDLVDYANNIENWNNSSYILRVEHAGRSIILPGDAEEPAWDKLEATVPELLPCDVLKASHHGRKSGYSETAVDAMDPSCVICSVGKKPDTDASALYAGHGAKVLSTRKNGTISVTISDEGDIDIVDRNGDSLASMRGWRRWIA